MTYSRCLNCVIKNAKFVKYIHRSSQTLFDLITVETQINLGFFMKNRILIFASALILAGGMVSCSNNDSSNQALKKPVAVDRKADSGILDKIKGFLKKKVRVALEFGHNEPDGMGGINECVYKGLCKAEVEVELGISTNGAGGYDLNGDFLFMFEKSTMTSGQIAYQFDNNEFDLVDGITIPQEGIYQGTSDQDLTAGIYNVVYEDSEVIVVNFE